MIRIADAYDKLAKRAKVRRSDRGALCADEISRSTKIAGRPPSTTMIRQANQDSHAHRDCQRYKRSMLSLPR